MASASTSSWLPGGSALVAVGWGRTRAMGLAWSWMACGGTAGLGASSPCGTCSLPYWQAGLAVLCPQRRTHSLSCCKPGCSSLMSGLQLMLSTIPQLLCSPLPALLNCLLVKACLSLSQTRKGFYPLLELVGSHRYLKFQHPSAGLQPPRPPLRHSVGVQGLDTALNSFLLQK